MSNPLTQFRIVAIAEGISFLVLLGIAMPLRRLGVYHEGVTYAGWTHGVLFILYIITVLRVAHFGKWQAKRIAAAIVASLLPFGPFVFDHRMKDATAEPNAGNEPAQ